MKLDFCVVCGCQTDLHQHHIEPVVFSKKKRIKSRQKVDINKPLNLCSTFEIFSYLFDEGYISDNDTITVCSYHHNLLHGIMKFQKTEHGNMIKEGLEEAKRNGIVLGRPSTAATKENYESVKSLRNQGWGIKRISTHLKIGVGSVYALMEKDGSEFIENTMTFVDLLENSNG